MDVRASHDDKGREALEPVMCSGQPHLGPPASFLFLVYLTALHAAFTQGARRSARRDFGGITD